MTDENAFEVIDELKRINVHLAQIGEALEWFNVLQRDRDRVERVWSYTVQDPPTA